MVRGSFTSSLYLRMPLMTADLVSLMGENPHSELENLMTQ